MDDLANTVAAEQQHVVTRGVAQANGDAFAKHAAHRRRLRRASPAIERSEDLIDRLADGFLLRPSGEGLGDAVHERHAAIFLSDDDSFIDTADGGGQALSTFD